MKQICKYYDEKNRDAVNNWPILNACKTSVSSGIFGNLIRYQKSIQALEKVFLNT